MRANLFLGWIGSIETYNVGPSKSRSTTALLTIPVAHHSNAFNTHNTPATLPSFTRIIANTRLFLIVTDINPQLPRQEHFRGEDEGGESSVHEGTCECVGEVQ